jgi:hypothetical protein
MIETGTGSAELEAAVPPVVWDAGDEQLLAQLAGRAASKGLSLAAEGGFLQADDEPEAATAGAARRSPG